MWSKLNCHRSHWPGSEAQYANTETALEENEKKLVALSETDIPSLKEALKQVQTEIEFSKVVLSTEQTAGDKLMLLEGWAPATSKVEIEAYLNDAHIYYEITDPTPETQCRSNCK